MGTTSILWRRDHTPHWGDETLTRGLSHWGKTINPIEAKFLFRGLIYTTLAIPVEPGQDPLQQGSTLRVVQDPDGTWNVPVFTHPELLKQFAFAMHWCNEGEEIPWSSVPGKEAFASLSQVEGIECRVNPGSSTLRLDQAALKLMGEGNLPDPRSLGSARRGVAAPAISVTEAPRDYAAAQAMVPERALATLKMMLEQMPDVTLATLYKPLNGPVTLGLRFASPRSLSDPAVQSLEKILARAGVMAATALITRELEAALMTIPPFFWRKV